MATSIHGLQLRSPDEFVYDPNFDPSQRLVEFKNQYAVRDKTVAKAASNISFCLQFNKEGKRVFQKSTIITFRFNVQCIALIVNGVTSW